MNKFNIKELMNKSSDFIKAHYEYILPFSLFFLIEEIGLKLINSPYTLPFSILLLPLSFSVAYFAHKINTGAQKRIGLFFEVYTYFFKFFGILLVKYLIILLIFSPFIFNMVDVMKEFDFDTEKLALAIQSKSYVLNKTTSLNLVCCSFLFLLIYPFIVFVEFFAILNDEDILYSFKKSYITGTKYYFSIFILLIISFICLLIGAFFCCFGLIVAVPYIFLLLYFAFRTHISTEKEIVSFE